VRSRIIAIMNAVWDDGLYITFGQLPYIITPDSQIYRTDRCLETIRHAKAASALFIWMKSSHLLQHSIPNAPYAVAFFVPGAPPLQVLDLSYVLLRFMDKYIRSGDYHRFNAVSLCYQVRPEGSIGVLFFDRRLRTAYRQARMRARASANMFRRRYTHPIYTWPRNSEELN
ncbi:hypothetical protein C8R43DRAFT_852218, partial [Mycena crocata]